MTPEEVEAILKSNSKAIASNSNTIAECRREISALYGMCRELTRDRAVMFDILQGLNEDRAALHENLADIAENVAKLASNVAKLAENQ